VTGTPSPGATQAPDRQRYEHPNTGRGFSIEPLDQPSPMPHYGWHGWEQRCAWASPELLAQLGAIAAPVSGPFGCVLPLAGDDIVEIA
jgi:hypothetical protein